MKLKKTHAKSILFATSLMRKTAAVSKKGKALDELRHHIEALDELQMLVIGFTTQSYFDFEKIERISRKKIAADEVSIKSKAQETPLDVKSKAQQYQVRSYGNSVTLSREKTKVK